MSVRRLAEDNVQPDAFAFNRANASWAKKKIKDYPKGREASAVIPLLMRAQEQEGWVTKAAIEHIAHMLDMPMIRVLEVATFYTQFQLAPVGKKAHVQVCGTTPCMLRGAGDLIETCKKRISPNQFEVTENGALSWEEVECQGACVNAPMVMIFKDTYEDLTPKRLEEIIDAFEAGNGDSVEPGPQIDRVYSAPIGGPTSLTNGVATKSKNSGAPKGSSRKAGRSQEATIAARPASHAATTSPAVDTPVGRKASQTAKMRASKKRSEANTPSPKKTLEKKANGKATKPVAQKLAAKQNAVGAGKPKGIRKPKSPDDLKLISGVGPKIETILNDLGIWKFEQVAGWKKAERDWVDGYLRFKGRIERDDWVKQAKALAKGGEAEYVKVFGKKPR